jgi:hypothetical protein
MLISQSWLKLNVILAGYLATIAAFWCQAVNAREVSVNSSSVLVSKSAYRNTTQNINPNFDLVAKPQTATNSSVTKTGTTMLAPPSDGRMKTGTTLLAPPSDEKMKTGTTLLTPPTDGRITARNPLVSPRADGESKDKFASIPVKVTPDLGRQSHEVISQKSILDSSNGDSTKLSSENRRGRTYLIKEEIPKFTLETSSNKPLSSVDKIKAENATALLNTVKLDSSRNWNIIADNGKLRSDLQQAQVQEKPSDAGKPADANNQNNGDKPVNDPLQELEELKIPEDSGYRFSPGFTIAVPTGYGADNNTVFIGASYQNRTRFTKKSDGEMGFGIGLGNSATFVGVELSYTLNSFGTSAGSFGDASGFGTGGFSAKIHRQITDSLAVAVGWNQFLRIEKKVASDYPKNSYYAVGTKIFRLRESIRKPFSRVAVTVGVGGGEFTDFDSQVEAFILGEDPSGLGVFGSLGIRVLEPVSAIIEWTGQDLGIGLSIVPFKNLPLVITPAVRDISGAGDGARFIMGVGFGFQL